MEVNFGMARTHKGHTDAPTTLPDDPAYDAEDAQYARQFACCLVCRHIHGRQNNIIRQKNKRVFADLSG
jgi:hypothetical protein